LEKLICTIKQIGREWYRSLLISTIHQNHYLINRVRDKKKVTELFKKVSVIITMEAESADVFSMGSEILGRLGGKEINC